MYHLPNPQVFVYTKLQKQVCPGCNTTVWLYSVLVVFC